MTAVRNFCLIAVLLFGLAPSAGLRAQAQPAYSNELRGLNQQIAALLRDGNYATAVPLVERALAIYRSTGSREGIAQMTNQLGMLDSTLGRYEEAEARYREAIAVYADLFGPNDRNVAIVESNLADLSNLVGHFSEAETLYKQAIAILEKAVGLDHFYVARTLNNLARVYTDQGRYNEAEPLYKRALPIVQRTRGEHRDFATVLISLASLYATQGRYSDAEGLFKRAIPIYEREAGRDVIYLGATLNNLAFVYDRQGRYDEAEPLLKRVLVMAENQLGPNHPHVADALKSLAECYGRQGRYAEAEPLYKRSLAIFEKALGPDHPDVGKSLSYLGELYVLQRRYADAEPLYKRSLAILEKALGTNHPDVVRSLNELAWLYVYQQRYGDGLALMRTTGGPKTWVPLPVIYGAETEKLMDASEAMDDSLTIVQASLQTAVSSALNALAIRFAAGNDRLAELVRRDQDLAGEAANLDKAIVAAMSGEASRRNAASEEKLRARMTAIAKERDDMAKVFQHDFPDYAALSRPQPLTVKDVQQFLANDEALIIIYVGAKKSYVWAITKTVADWKELPVTEADVSKKVTLLRGVLDFHSITPFDAQASFELYRTILAPVEAVIRNKPRLSLVLNGALTSLPPQLLVTRDPADKALRDVDWLVRSHAVTLLPSVASLKVLRGKSAVAEAEKPLIGFADPLFNRDPQQLAQNTRLVAAETAARGVRGSVADISELKTALPRLPETADELRQVAASVHADPKDLIIGADATETRVKRERLDRFRIVYFATHGLLAGDVADFAKLNAEPALVLSLPEHPTELDDGLLTASEVAQLKLNADWVALSACNTASGEKPGAEALSGLARAFFYAGARSLIVSNWEVDSQSAVALMTGTFTALATNPKLSHGEALQKSMLTLIDNAQHPQWADPKYWAPFVVVGEPAKLAN